MLEREAKRQSYKPANILKEDWLRNVANKLSLNNTEDLYAGLGYGSITLPQVMPKLKELYNKHYKIDEDKIITETRTKDIPLPKKNNFSNSRNKYKGSRQYKGEIC